MNIANLTIQNFLAINEAKINLKERGLVAVEGRNEADPSAESNGAGKSSVLDAICWVLFGVTARGVSSDAVINRHVGKDTLVSAEIEDDGKVYTVTRHRKHKTGKNSVTVFDGSTDLSKGTDKETQLVIEQIIGCSHSVFVSAIYAGQEAMPDLPGMTDKQLKVLIEEAAGISQLERCAVIAREKKAEVVNQMNANAALLERLDVDLSNKQTTINMLAEQKKNKRLALTEAASKKLEDAKLLAENGKLAVKALSECEDEGKIEAEKNRILQAAKDATEAGKALLDLERNIGRLNGDIRITQNNLTMLKDTLKGLNELALQKPARDNCHTCGAPMSAEKHAAVCKTRSDEIAAKINKVKADQVKAEAAIESLRAELSKQEASVKAKQLIVDAGASAVSEVEKLNASLAKTQKHRMLVESIKAQLNATKEAYKSLVASVKDIDEGKDEFSVRSLAFEEEADRLNGKIEKLRLRDAELERELKIAEAAVSVFGPAGVRAHILDTVTPLLNERTAEYLSILSDGNIHANWSTLSKTAKGELREKFVIDVSNDTGATTFAGLSGGEKRKVRLATAMALQDLVASRAAKPINIFIADEIDNALDGAGLERLMTVLENKARIRGTVLVVSHNSLSDWISDTIVVTKNSSGGSTVAEYIH